MRCLFGVQSLICALHIPIHVSVEYGYIFIHSYTCGYIKRIIMTADGNWQCIFGKTMDTHAYTVIVMWICTFYSKRRVFLAPSTKKMYNGWPHIKHRFPPAAIGPKNTIAVNIVYSSFQYTPMFGVLFFKSYSDLSSKGKNGLSQRLFKET